MIFYSIIAFIGSIFASAIYFSFKIFGMIFGAIFHVIADIFNSFSGGGNEGKQDKASERNTEEKSTGQTTSNHSLSDKAKAILCIIAIVVGYVLYNIIIESLRPDKPTEKNVASALSQPVLTNYNFISEDVSLQCDKNLDANDFGIIGYKIRKEGDFDEKGRYRVSLVIDMKALHDVESQCTKITRRLNENSGSDWAGYCEYHPDWCAKNQYTIEHSRTYRDENENYVIAKESLLSCYQDYFFVPSGWEWKVVERYDDTTCKYTDAKGDTYFLMR